MADREGLLERALQDLQWRSILDRLASHAFSTVGAERCRGLTLAASLAQTQDTLRETAEMISLEHRSGGVPLGNFPDVRPVIERLAKGAVPTGLDFRDVSIVLSVVADDRRFLRSRQGDAPGLEVLAADLDELRPLKIAIDRAIDPEGNILESATPELRTLTHHANTLRQRIRSRLEAILASPRFAEILQEAYFAEREHRYVIPVKTERKGDVPGIIHDVSASGATVFGIPARVISREATSAYLKNPVMPVPTTNTSATTAS